ncbi:class I adenylate-forming enzyme family protein [Chitinasiproducens palmae]|uniref:Acyl-CoA synthetase (AMP-forming)/AMP-acid ligase II n=1 Tax=Chitinasiproducens palmae TaxID=1770053 RepID=A0A1H2PN94_9BURK|nr:class I adenylate-forming enzyme family protein [Chitinasiproducens palmae]SDV48046.1 Acyl-CoA synthetase (AMP-forming)/AMP-acid ligase II [Chitinasiproducens palmae]
MERNFGDLIGMTERNRDDVALIDCCKPPAVRTFSRAQLDSAFNACARGFARRGLVPGDVVALVAANSVEFLIAYFGALRAGMVIVPVNHKLNDDTIRFILADCGAKLIVEDGTHRIDARDVDTIVIHSAEWQDLVEPSAAAGYRSYQPGDDDVAVIMYTSGSTGRPKGVMLTHRGQVWSVAARLPERSLASERFIVAAPLFHMNGLASVQFALAAGASVVLQAQFKASEFVRAIGRHDVTWITSVPTMMALAVRETDALRDIDTSKVHYIRLGSAATTRQMRDSVRAAFPNATLAGGYGTTESGPITFGPTQGRAVPDGALGWPLPNVDVRLVGADGADDPRAGELWVRTPANMKGYLNLPEKTASVLLPEGWYRTGDMFEVGKDGAYRFVGRVDDMFNCGGENIYPGEVEQVLEQMPAILQACVVAIPDELKGQKPVAFVVLRERLSASEDEIKAFVLARAPAYQHPRAVHFLQSMPLASTNKVDRKQLTALAEARANAKRNANANAK